MVDACGLLHEYGDIYPQIAGCSKVLLQGTAHSIHFSKYCNTLKAIEDATVKPSMWQTPIFCGHLTAYI